MYDHELDHGSYLNSNILMYDHELTNQHVMRKLIYAICKEQRRRSACVDSLHIRAV